MSIAVLVPAQMAHLDKRFAWLHTDEHAGSIRTKGILLARERILLGQVGCLVMTGVVLAHRHRVHSKPTPASSGHWPSGATSESISKDSSCRATRTSR